MKNFILLFFSISFLSCGSQLELHNINKEIRNKNIAHYNNSTAKNNGKKSFSIRKKMIKQGGMNFILDSAEIFILEGYDFEIDRTTVLIWNKQNEICYVSNIKGYRIIDNPFSLEMKELISKWKINQIKAQKNIFIGGLDITISRIKLAESGNVLTIDYFSFDEFFTN